MYCDSCNAAKPAGWTYCDVCGSELREPPPVPEPPAAVVTPEDPSDTAAVRDLQSRLQSLQQEVRNIRESLSRVGIPVSPHVPPTEPAQPPSATVEPARPAGTARLGVPVGGPTRPVQAAPSVQTQTPPRRTPPPRQGPRIDWEFLVGVNWLAIVGAVAFVIGTGFFLRLAIDNDWIGETGRVVLGVIVGAAFIGAGEFWRRSRPAWAQAMTGGGIGILYLAVFAAFSLYELIDPVPAFAIFALITAGAGIQALRHESVAVAILGIVGGFATPLMLQDNLPDARLLLGYVLLLDVGVLGLSTRRNWRWFTLLALIGSLADYGLWAAEFNPRDNLLLGQVGITLIFLMFTGVTSLTHILRNRRVGPADYGLMVLNASAYFGISYGQLWGDFRPWLGGFTVAMAGLYAGLAALAISRSNRPEVSITNIAIAAVLIAIFIPVQLGGPWLSVAWAAEGAVVMWMSFRLGMWQLRPLAMGAFGVFALWLLFADTPDAFSADLTPFANGFFPAYVISAAAVFFAAYLYRQRSEELREWETSLFPVFLGAGNLVLTLMVPIQLDSVWITVTWAAEALALMALSFRLGIVELRQFSLGVFAATAIRLVAVDTPAALSDDFTPLLNQYVFAFGATIGAAFLAAFLLRRNAGALQVWEKYVSRGFVVAGVALLTLAVPVQLSGVWVAVTWAAMAIGLMALSGRMKMEELSWTGLGVLAVMAVRLVAFDTQVDLDGFRPIVNMRMVAFGSGIAALYGAAYLTWKGRVATKSFTVDIIPFLLVAANFLTLYVLSAEVIASVDSGVIGVSDSVAGNAKSLGLSLLWATYASIALVTGIFKGFRSLRLAGLALLAVPVLKLFLVDSFQLDQGYRVAAFLILGAMLLAGGFLYQRYRIAIDEFLFTDRK